MQQKGVWYAVGAYSFWGLVPLFWYFFTWENALALVAYRIVWSFVFYFILFKSLGKKIDFSIIKNKTVVLNVFIAALLLSVNWLLYIWAVNNHFVVESSLGYFINPLINVLLGWLLLEERLTKYHKISFLIALIGVIILTFQYGHFPWIALTLAITFGLYGLIRKTLKVDVLQASLMEAGILVVPSMVLLFYVPNISVMNLNLHQFGLLISTGIVTGLPLFWFAMAAKKMPLSSLGFFQYIAPTIQFLLGIFFFKEPFTAMHFIGFSFIWLALLVFISSLVINKRRSDP